jgi:hypothetical protein
MTETPWIIEILQNALDAWNEKLAQVFNILTSSPQSFGGGTIYSVIQDINGAMQSIGLGLLVIFMLVGIVKKSTSYEDMKRPEQILKLFLQFAIAKAVISYGMPIMENIFSIGLGIIGKMGVTQIDSISALNTICRSCKQRSASAAIL